MLTAPGIAGAAKIFKAFHAIEPKNDPMQGYAAWLAWLLHRDCGLEAEGIDLKYIVCEAEGELDVIAMHEMAEPMARSLAERS